MVLAWLFLFKGPFSGKWDMFLFQLCYIISSVWMREGNIPIDYNFQKHPLAT